MLTPRHWLDEREAFLFDTQGYAVLRGVLDADCVVRLNAAVDANAEAFRTDPTRTGSAGSALSGERARLTSFTDPLRWPREDAKAFAELIAPPEVQRWLDSLMGRGWRLDGAPQILLAGTGAEGLHLHGSGSQWFSPVTYYACQNGLIRCGLVTVEYALSPAGPGDGGFACIPGSHKANFGCPRSIAECESDAGVVHQPVLEPGDAVVWTEALFHGTLPWRAAHERRVALFRYTPRVMNLSGAYLHWSLPAWVSELDLRDRVALNAPYLEDRPVLLEDGTVSRVTEWY